MGERKVIQHYYPPDFDPKELRNGPKRATKSSLHHINMMLPLTFYCIKCGEYMGAGTKVNSMKEKALGFEYLGIPSFRFYQRCKGCHAEFTFRTDPQHSCYVPEAGVTASYNPQLERAEAEQIQQVPVPQSAMEELEARVLRAKRELEQEDRLEKLLELRKEQEKRGFGAAKVVVEQDAMDDLIAAAAFAKKIKRIYD
jgi:hypothetical protein